MAHGLSIRFERFTFFKPPALPEVYDYYAYCARGVAFFKNNYEVLRNATMNAVKYQRVRLYVDC